MAPAQSKPCHFFRLPAELRNDIYELVMYPQDPAQTTRKLSDTARHRKQDDKFAPFSVYGYQITAYYKYKPPVLLATNRQIRNEASKLFYGRTLFYVRPGWKATFIAVWSFMRWFRSLTEVDRKLVKGFNVEMFEYEPKRATDLEGAKVLTDIFAWALEEDEKAILKMPILAADLAPEVKYMSVLKIEALDITSEPQDYVVKFYAKDMAKNFRDLVDGTTKLSD